MPYLAIGAIVLVISLAIAYWPIALLVALLVLGIVYVPRMVRHILKNQYFASEGFLAHKAEIAAVVAEHNDVAAYTAEIRSGAPFRLGVSSTGAQSHLARFENTSVHNHRRDRNEANYNAPNVHNCSLQVVRNAKSDPLKYVMKYFDIKADESHLSEVEGLGDDISRLENAVGNLRQREALITRSVNPPPFIVKYFNDEFMEHVGVDLSPIEVPYPEYVFEYVSAGGNSGQKAAVTLNSETIDALITTISETIRYRKSAAGQRALMTSKLRESIKLRDDYSCCYCAVSIAAEPNLLLEVDHILPVSRGGLSTNDNLQTLCWRCNRRKSNKIIAT